MIWGPHGPGSRSLLQMTHTGSLPAPTSHHLEAFPRTTKLPLNLATKLTPSAQSPSPLACMAPEPASLQSIRIMFLRQKDARKPQMWEQSSKVLPQLRLLYQRQESIFRFSRPRGISRVLLDPGPVCSRRPCRLQRALNPSLDIHHRASLCHLGGLVCILTRRVGVSLRWPLSGMRGKPPLNWPRSLWHVAKGPLELRAERLWSNVYYTALYPPSSFPLIFGSS